MCHIYIFLSNDASKLHALPTIITKRYAMKIYLQPFIKCQYPDFWIWHQSCEQYRPYHYTTNCRNWTKKNIPLVKSHPCVSYILELYIKDWIWPSHKGVVNIYWGTGAFHITYKKNVISSKNTIKVAALYQMCNKTVCILSNK